MKFRNGGEMTGAGKATLVSALVLCFGLGLGAIVTMAPPSEVEVARAEHLALDKARDQRRQELLSRELGRRLNGG